MSCNYSDGLSEYHDKGVCGLPEVYDDSEKVYEKVKMLAEMIRQANHVVVHTGAGISTAAGIPDFRGPRGVWTLEQQGEKPQVNISFDNAVPTSTHMALVALVKSGFIHYVISQNVDGLYIRSGFPSDKLSELHGNMLLDKCAQCDRLFIRNKASTTVGQKCTGQSCPLPKTNGRSCRGKLHDTILDWEDELPQIDLEMAEIHSRTADLSICLGTTLQIVPSGNLPLLTKNNGGKLVICNLQPTKHDKHADLIIHDYIDSIIGHLTKLLGVEIPEYSSATDPAKCVSETPVEYQSGKINLIRQGRKKNHKGQNKETIKGLIQCVINSSQNNIKLEKDNIQENLHDEVNGSAANKRHKTDLSYNETLADVDVPNEICR